MVAVHSNHALELGIVAEVVEAWRQWGHSLPCSKSHEDFPPILQRAWSIKLGLSFH